ncbi:MAG: ABC transporter ATP-binding protein [Egibacteraceae bacterium]
MRSSRATHWRLLTDMLRPHRRVVGLLAVAVAASGALPLAGPQLLRAFVDRAVAGGRIAGLLVIAGAYAGIGLLTQAAAVVTTYAATRVAWKATNELRERACAHVLGLDLGYHARSRPGTLIERIDGDATAISTFFTTFVVQVAAAAVTMIGALLLVAREDWRACLAMTAFVAAGLAVMARLRDRAVAHSAAERAAFASVMGVVEEQLDGAEDLRALGAGPHALGHHERSSGKALRAALGRGRAQAVIEMWAMGFFAAGGLLMLAGAGMLERRGLITVGTVFLLFQYTQVLRRPVELIADQLQEVQRAAAGAGRMQELLATGSALPAGGRAAVPGGALAVSFDGVSFCYAEGRPVLHDVCLAIRPGEVVGLVGHSGSGKTTLARLALRLLDPTTGAVRVGGVDLRDADPHQLRRRVGIITQDVQLLSVSVRDNLTLFDACLIGDSLDPCVPDSTLVELLDDLGLRDWLRGLPAGLDTVIGQGTDLSAGQAQLLGLGRAFLQDPGLLVLDEASSRIDPVTAELVERALDRLLDGRTAIVIAHRLRSVARAGTVVVLDQGRIVEAGPRDLLAADETSRFAALLRADRSTLEVSQ